MIPGEVFTLPGDIELNAGAVQLTLTVANTGDRPDPGGQPLPFCGDQSGAAVRSCESAGASADIAAGTAVRFEPGATREVVLIPFGGTQTVQGFRGGKA